MRQINFLTEDIVKEVEAKAIRLSFMIAGSLLAVLLLVNFVVLSKGIKNAESQYQSMLQQEHQAVTQEESYALTELHEKIEGIKTENAEYQMFFGLDRLNTILLKTISNLTENKVWLSELSADSVSGKCAMSGSGYSGEALGAFIQSLKDCPLFESADLGNMENDSVQADMVNFSLDCSLKMKQKKPEDAFDAY